MTITQSSSRDATRTCVESPAPGVHPRAITASHLVTSYGSLDVLRDVSLAVATGEVFGLIGPNGAGKTTLVESIVGLRVPDEGAIDVLGMSPVRHREQFTTRVAVQPQESNLFENVRVREAVELFASFYPRPFSVADVLDRVGLTDFSRHLVRKLSGGQRRRLLLGVALIGAPELIVLDEPSAGLDPQARRALWEVIRQLRASGTTVLLTTHHMDEAAELCDRVAFMIDGRIEAIGTPHDLITQRAGAQVVTFETTTSAAPDLQECLTAKQFVTAINLQTRGDRVCARVTTDDADGVLAIVVGTSQWRACDIRVEKGDLEDLFLELTADRPASSERRTRHGSFIQRLSRKDHDS